MNLRLFVPSNVGEMEDSVETLMNRMALICAATLSILLVTNANAQMKVDMAAFTCGDLASMDIEEFVVVGAWMNGYYSAKRGNAMVDAKQLRDNTMKVIAFCKSNPAITVMKAIETLSAAQK